MKCPARIKPFPGHEILDCHLEVGHDDGHESALRDKAWVGSVTKVGWLDSDRRNFTGPWIECPNIGCILPAGHRGKDFIE